MSVLVMFVVTELSARYIDKISSLVIQIPDSMSDRSAAHSFHNVRKYLVFDITGF